MSLDTKIQFVLMWLMSLWLSMTCIALLERSAKHTAAIETLTSCIQQQTSINDTSRLAIADLAAEVASLKHKR